MLVRSAFVGKRTIRTGSSGPVRPRCRRSPGRYVRSHGAFRAPCPPASDAWPRRGRGGLPGRDGRRLREPRPGGRSPDADRGDGAPVRARRRDGGRPGARGAARAPWLAPPRGRPRRAGGPRGGGVPLSVRHAAHRAEHRGGRARPCDSRRRVSSAGRGGRPTCRRCRTCSGPCSSSGRWASSSGLRARGRRAFKGGWSTGGHCSRTACTRPSWGARGCISRARCRAACAARSAGSS